MFTVSALYHFVPLTNLEELQTEIKEACNRFEIKGTLLLATEGINGTIAGSQENIESILAFLRGKEPFAGLIDKKSFASEEPFRKMKVRLKKEIVTMGVENVQPAEVVGEYVQPEDWNQLIADPNVIVVDTRNDYEFRVGTFKHALNPETKTFREFPDYIQENLEQHKEKKIAMFCTGGIRCEKATSYMKQQGFEKVYHLQGGILKYLEEVPQEQSLWEGECYVFDHRVSVKHGLELGSYEHCHACGEALNDEDKQHPDFVEGISCAFCIGTKSEEKIRGYKERQKQIELERNRKQKVTASS